LGYETLQGIKNIDRTKKIRSDKEIILRLKPTVKIIDEIKKMKKDVFLAGFKAEDNKTDKELKKKAISSLKKCNANMFIANDIGKDEVFGSDYNSVLIVDEFGKTEKIGRARKEVIAEKIVDAIRSRI